MYNLKVYSYRNLAKNKRASNTGKKYFTADHVQLFLLVKLMSVQALKEEIPQHIYITFNFQFRNRVHVME